jgi:hypothetical protein
VGRIGRNKNPACFQAGCECFAVLIRQRLRNHRQPLLHRVRIRAVVRPPLFIAGIPCPIRRTAQPSLMKAISCSTQSLTNSGYVNGVRNLLCDIAPAQLGYRYTAHFWSVGNNTSWQSTGIINSPVSANAWEAAQVFDASALVADLGDGQGAIPRIIYAGSDTHSSTDNTDSSIGLTYLQP